MTRLVAMKDHKPLVIKKAEMEDDVWLCRCGLSADWPYCDSSHKRTLNEQKDKTYRYVRDSAGGELVQAATDAPAADFDPRPGT